MKKTNIRIKGFLGAGLHCGIKENDVEDLSLIFSTTKARAAGVFTTNAFKAAPVEIDMKKIKSGWAQAVITNSGNANAASGKKGKKDAMAMTRAVSDKLKIDDSLVLVTSTGVIGKKLPMMNIKRGIGAIVPLLGETGIENAQRAMMTTDKFPKIAFRQAIIGGKEIRLCTIAKGAGMIQPNMATMLSYTLTDANIDGRLLRKLFCRAIDKTLNAISVDGCMSTNDTAIIMANGCAENAPIKNKGAAANAFYSMLESSLNEIAEMIVADGEGATKVMEIIVEEAVSPADAKKAAYAIGNSNLVKTAFYGCDPNFGRIIGALGASGAKFNPQKVRVALNDVCVFANETSVAVNIKTLQKIMSQQRVRILASLGAGKHSHRLLASDLSHEYVTINAHYRT